MPQSPSHSVLSDSTQSSNCESMHPILQLDNVTVQRGDFPLCNKVNLSLSEGDICHLIGANGTGKTTLMMQLAGLLPLLEGDIYYQGQSGLPIAPLYVSHQLGIHPNLSVAQNLTFLLNLYGITPTSEQIEDALAWVGLAGYERISSNQLSAGQTRRITLARLHLMTPRQTPLWLLDEPFTALDVDMIDNLQQRMQQFVQSGGAILMTSHQSVNVANKSLNLSDYLPIYPLDDITNYPLDDMMDDDGQEDYLEDDSHDTNINNNSQNTNNDINDMSDKASELDGVVR